MEKISELDIKEETQLLNDAATAAVVDYADST